MNTIRFCFTATVVFLVVAIGGRVTSYEDNTVPFWKCCPLDRLYNPKVRYCRLVRTDVEEYRHRLVNRLEDGFRMAADATLNVTYHLPPYCNATEVLVDVPAEEMRELMDSHSSPYQFPPGYCFDLMPSGGLVSRTCRPRDQYCGRFASCEEYTVPFRKCCPLDRLYDPEAQFCRPAGTDLNEYQQRLKNQLQHGFRVAAKAKLIMTFDWMHNCNRTEVLVNVSAEEMHELMEAHSSVFELPLDYCFDLTPADELVARTCRPRDQYCGRPGYTCVPKCCHEREIFFDDPDEKNRVTCKKNEMPFKLSVYETDGGGSPVVLSNNTVLPINGRLSCYFDSKIYNSFMLTTDGKLHMEDGKWIIPETEYCLEHYSEVGSQKAAHLTAHVCTNSTPPPLSFAFWVIFPASVVCLVLTLIVYATLPYLRNAHGYYVMFYMACQLVYFICEMIDWMIKHDLDSPLCIPFGYFSLFAILTTCCWLNVICFDIYWLLRNTLTCKKSKMPFKLSIYETDAGGSPVGRSNNTVLPIIGRLSCTLESGNYNSFMLTTDDKLHINTEFGEWFIPETEYCLEYYSEDGPPEAADLMAHVCTNYTQPPHSFAIWVIISASVVCLVLTLIVYAILPYLRNANGYYVMFYMVCQLVYFICTMIMWTIKHDLDSPLCIPFGYFYLFATLTTCCWLNVICFDIYWILRYNNSTNRRNTSKSVLTIMYHVYCWGFSSIIVSTGYLFQHSQNEMIQELAPDIGKYSCVLYNYYSYGTFIFLNLPTCGTLTANLVLFILTAIHCSRIKSELNNFQQTDSKIQIFLVYKERFVMGIKLFMVFGIPFLLSMLCRLFHIIEWETIWRVIDRIYYLQGVYIFIIFVAKRKVIMEIRKKFIRSTVQSESIQLTNTTGTS